MDFAVWCQVDLVNFGTHELRRLAAEEDELDGARDEIAEVVPRHYASEEHLARVLRNLGKQGAADFITARLPQTKAIRSGDLGEILATEYVSAHTFYATPVKRLRWKDHREMAMRGDDLIGIGITPVPEDLYFLKVEAKSRVAMTTSVIGEARQALDANHGLPSAHALSFISSRLVEQGQVELADRIDLAQYQRGIAPQNIQHLLFSFSGNDGSSYLQASIVAYGGGIAQIAVALRVVSHADFIGSVYEAVIANAHDD